MERTAGFSVMRAKRDFVMFCDRYNSLGQRIVFA